MDYLPDVGSPRILRIDERHVYFAGYRTVLRPTGGIWRPEDVVLRVPRHGGVPEEFFNPARLFAATANLVVDQVVLEGDDPSVSFRVVEAGATQQAIYRVTPPIDAVPFPAVPAGFPSVILRADGRYGGGAEASLVADVRGTGPFTYEWRYNGQPLPSGPASPWAAVEGTLAFVPFVQPYHEGNYTLRVTNATGTAIVSAPVSIATGHDLDGGTPPAVINLSARGYSTGAEGTFAAGLTLVAPVEISYRPATVLTPVAGTSQRVLVRAVGPGLAPFSRDDVVPAPATRLELYRGHDLLARNDGAWDSDPGLAAVADSVGAFPLTRGSGDSALVLQLPPQAYTVQVAAPAGESTVLTEL